MACKVKKAKAGAHLGLQIFWNGLRSWETTTLEDTSENRDFIEAQAKIISREIKHGTFDYLKHFPDGNKAHLFRREAPRPAAPETVKSYYEKWIERRANQVRPQQVKCEKSYFKKHVLPAQVAGQEFSDLYLAALATHHLQELQDSFKAKRIIGDKPYKAASINKYVRACSSRRIPWR